MLELWNNTSLAIFDFLLGWLLYLPSDLVLLGLAVATAGLMALVRPFTTNQDLLRRIDQDRSRLKFLMREAKAQRDKAALARYRATSGVLSLRKLGAEIKPLVVVILPVALLATWAMFRVEFHPPEEDEPVEVVAYFSASPLTSEWVAPASAAGDIMHVVPRTGLAAVTGWVQPIKLQENEPGVWDHFLARLNGTENSAPEPDAVAVWTVKGKARKQPYSLIFCHKGKYVRRDFQVGQRTYAPSWGIDDRDPFITEIKMREVKLLGVVPGLGSFFPAWLVGYLIIVLPLVFVMKGLLRIH